MSGHNKWSTIKHKKGKTDAARAKSFTKVTRQIIVAAREGGGNPELNFRLRLAIQKARAVNMPNDNIQRAVKKAVGGEEGAFEQVTYEGYGPGGVAVMVETMTDNRNRTAADVRHLFSKYGGNMGEAGCVAWMFDRKGYLAVDMSESNLTEETLTEWALEGGAEDLRIEDEVAEVFTTPEDLQAVKEFMESKDVQFSEVEITMVPKNTIAIDAATEEKVTRLLEMMDENDDVQQVYANFETE